MKKLLSLALVLAACGSSSKQPAASETTQPQAAADSNQEARDVCRATFVRQRECTDEFLPALVDLRIKLDQPPGIAGEDRDALMAEARTEWESDTTDASIAATCDQILSGMPLADLDAAMTAQKSCLEAADCAAFVSCEMPLVEGMMSRKR